MPVERLIRGRRLRARQRRGAHRLQHREGRHRRGERARLAGVRRDTPRRSGPASRSATRSPRSSRSRRAWRCSTGTCFWACRTSAAPASPARPARPPSAGGCGMDVDVSKVPLREPGMEPIEIMMSESQERMFAICAPGEPRRGPRHLREVGSRRDAACDGDRGRHAAALHGRGGRRGGPGDARWRGGRSTTAPAEKPAYLDEVAGVRHGLACPAGETSAEALLTPARLAEHLQQAVGLRAVRPHGQGQHGAASRAATRRSSG